MGHGGSGEEAFCLFIPARRFHDAGEVSMSYWYLLASSHFIWNYSGLILFTELIHGWYLPLARDFGLSVY